MITELVTKLALDPSVTSNSSNLNVGLVAIGAGLATIGVFGTGIGQGVSAGRAAEAVGRNPEAASKIRALLLIALAISESPALYAFIIAILLVTKI
ncbi:ATP synthase subunit C [Mycoplasmopsis californica]|uniref:ATP synthase subunit c n=1 Tax=Mycoplasmopsis equigenitalium TaxID=114883 RepID=A0ABY5J3D6_9BACT|nr:F0F1 ATP synthase subunit C [Mycoplasmopsis equigenitalium]UUD37293.1 F0F1 ATP synthase subunit C [Mycoplasmopsis equigenitalium]VEU69397.1 ATP synthase subunit C [Mycoplasmopsis californica]